ncbi:permease-like cell division protein FtsX [Aliivibrio sp. S4TY2]|uniref:Cell division protein FtsX n=1 Tax=Aliivibrio finisterrensis TaxID=511998 RepID=A0A4Q5KIQ3_9GAMM|nr:MULTISPECIES: permease-like cell division protein FtsX [Aliivibrio]MCP3697612.1 cell division protein FtsX [Aliivibrio sp.]MDD9157742.1 permease-like cell division protein FtsX [Aliivibrio sp. S4TY2]MDD9161713.1 permease-like cell division protein FtsX [Aliivibrio sp. S4TY1]MDD9165743.1 permease-like cell division protein FtsX [Aliivibrio sp. S4MY2]MDD9169742.1 permease-like cell division protein FtsX [Aliivibrio sp. S4MY4]
MAKHKPKNTQGASNDGFWATHKKQAKLSFQELLRRPLGNLLTLAVIAMSLTLPSSMYLVGKNLTIVASKWQAPSQVSLYLQQEVAESKVQDLKSELEGWKEVEAVNYISPQEGLKELSEQSGFEQALTLLDSNPLPAVLIVSPKSDWQDKDKVNQLVNRLKQQSYVNEVRLDDDWLVRLEAIKHVAVVVATTLAILMFVAVFLIVGNTLRFNVLEQKDEIQVMKLVGATNTFILRPYLYTGMWFGLLGGFIAWLFTAIITVTLNGAVDNVAVLYESVFRLVGLTWDESLLLLMLSSFLGLFAARISVLRHLKEIEPV